jgi:peptide deformylase
MAILKILHYPDERLHTVAKAVDTVDGSIRKLVADMAETMYAAPGIGLAATQVDVHRRVIVIDTSDTRDDLRVFINPQIVDSGGSAEFEEGCLSVPGIFDKVQRAEWFKVQALDGNGHPFTLEADGILGDCIQHEIDHLAGRVFVEHLSRLKQQRILAKLRKQSRKVM